MYDPNNSNHLNDGQEDREPGGINDAPPFERREDPDGARVNGEYSFTYGKGPEPIEIEDDPPRTYSDAGYIPASEAPQITPRYNSYNTAPPPQKNNNDRREKSRSGGFARIVALCLVCALLGGVAGFGGALLAGNINGSGRNDSASIPPVTATDEPKSSEPASTPSGTGSTPLITSNGDGTILSSDQIYELACPQTVGISSEITATNIFGQTSSASVSGSGFIISADGYILTNYHVIEDALKGGYDINVMLYNGESYPAEVVGYERDGTDIAVLKIDATGLTPVTVGNSDDIKVGDAVYALGNPLGELTYTLTSGMVSALDRVIATSESEADSINMFQIDAAINKGNSGGPVFNSRGEVIGIATAKYSETGVEGLGFAIPINDAISIANELIENGYVSGKAYFGITVTTVTSYAAQYYNMVEGAYVYAVDDASCAATAGLKVGDVITKMDDAEITSQTDLIVAKRSYHAGDTASLTVYRNGEYITLSITFDEEVPSSDSQTQQEQQEKDRAEEFVNPFAR